MERECHKAIKDIRKGIIPPMKSEKLTTKIYNSWIKFGDAIGRVTSKIILFILFFLLFTPIALFFRVIGKDLLDKKIRRDKKSYWIERKEQPTSMRYQF